MRHQKRTPVLGFKGITEKDLENIMKFGKASDTIGGYQSKSFIELPYGLVRKDVPDMQKKSLHLEYILAILECQFDEVDISEVNSNEIMSFILWIRKQQQKITAIEERYLSSDPEPEMIAAGINKLDEFGALSTIHGLAQGDILRHAAIEAMPYYKVYEVLKLEKTNRDIKNAHINIIKAKNK